MYDRILAPTDGSDYARTAVEHAGALAGLFDATVEVLTTVDEWNLERVTREEDSRLAWAHEVADSAVSALESADVDVESSVEVGVAHEVIQEHAADCDLVVMGSRGRSGLERFLLGSVTETVVRTTNTPVLTVTDRDGGQRRFPYEHVLVPTDGSEGATAAAQHGVDLAAACGATVHAVSVVDERAIVGTVGSEQLRDTIRERCERAVTSVEGAASAVGLEDVRTTVLEGTPHRALGEYVRGQDVDVVVMGTHGRSGVDRLLLGSVAERMLRTSPVPVLTVRSPAAED